MNTYIAYVNDESELVVKVNDHPLPKRMDIHRYSQDYACGFAGGGAFQLSLALLAAHLQNDERALFLAEYFAWKLVVRLPRNGWTMTDRHINEALVALPKDP